MSIFEQLGVQPIINACGTVTRLGGAPMPPEVVAAWQAAAQQAVSLEQLQAAASVRIARAIQTESGLVTSGAAAAMTLGTAAILCRHDLARMERLPDTNDMPNEFIIAREQRSGYDHAVRAAGAKLVEVGFNELVAGAGVRRTESWEYEAAISQRTAGIVYIHTADSRPFLVDVMTLAHKHGIPVLVDAASELPPRSNLQAIPGTGADLVVFSGGKAIRGPQSTGILCGRKELISSAALQMLDMDDHPQLWEPPPDLIDRNTFTGMPRHGIGRGFKVSKEEIAALLTALDLFMSGAYDNQSIIHHKWLKQIADALAETNADVRIIEPTAPEQSPSLEIRIDPTVTGRTAFDVCRELRNGTPSIYVGHAKLAQSILALNPACLTIDSIGPLNSQLRHLLQT